MSDHIIQSAYSLAVDTLRTCYTPLGISAGKGHFDDFWGRDFNFAAWGVLATGDTEHVHRGLDTCIRHLSPDGQVPLRVGCGRLGQLLKFVGAHPQEQTTLYRQDKGLSRAQDPNSLTILTLARYAQTPEGVEYIRTHIATIRRIYHWYDSQLWGGLVYGGAYATWKDSVRMQGWTAINNILLIAATDAMVKIVSSIGDNPVFYRKQTKILKKFLRQKFWTGEYYAEWHDGKKRYDYFAPDANMLAIMLGITTEQETKSILATYHRYPELAYPFGALTNAQKYHILETFYPFALWGMEDYHNMSMRWTWIGLASVLAMVCAGDIDGARDALLRIAEVIVRDGRVYEVYESDGHPVRRRWYQSEEPFAWSASFFILAYEAIRTKTITP